VAETPPASADTESAPSPGANKTVIEEDDKALVLDPDSSYFKPGTGLVLKSRDGNFSMAPRLRAQFLYAWQKAEDAPARQSVQIRRARLQFKGNFWGKKTKFKVELAVSPGDQGVRQGEGQVQGSPSPGTTPLLDWYVDFTQHRDLTLRVGQYKVPFNRQRVVSSGDQQFVDRSIINAEFNVDRDIGLDLRSDDLFGLDTLRYYAGVWGGQGRNTNSTNDFGMMYIGRVEALPLGMFEDYEEADIERSPEPKLSLGLAYAHIEHAPTTRGILGSAPADGGTSDVDALTWDALFKYAGFSLYSEWAWRNADRNPGDATELDDTGAEVAIPVEGDHDGLGGMLQAGYLFAGAPFEIAARYGATKRIKTSNMAEETELGGAVSYYPGGHSFKVQGDYFHLTAQGPEQGAAKESEDQVRVQFQAAF
jgi:hypothetical protein